MVGTQALYHLCGAVHADFNQLHRSRRSIGGGRSDLGGAGLTPVSLGYPPSFLWPYVLLLLPMGIAADRYGARMVAGLGMGVWSLATIFTGLASGANAILATRIAMGAAESSSYPAGVRIIRDWVPRQERGLATSIMNSGSYAGPAIGAALVGWLISIFGWRASFIVGPRHRLRLADRLVRLVRQARRRAVSRRGRAQQDPRRA